MLTQKILSRSIALISLPSFHFTNIIINYKLHKKYIYKISLLDGNINFEENSFGIDP